MADGGDGGAGGGGRPLRFKEKQQQCHLCCPGVLLGLGCMPLLGRSLQLSSVAQLKKGPQDSDHTVVIAVAHCAYSGGKVV